MKHALKIECLPLRQAQADELAKVLRDFAAELGYSEDRISKLECRSRDGFIPFSNNFGGFECLAYQSQDYAYFEQTGFTNADAKVIEYYDYDLNCYKKENGYEENYDLTETELEDFETNWRANDSESSILFSADLMYMGVDDDGVQSLNIKLCVCVKDAPYHREYDDIIDLDVEFNSAGDLVPKLETIKAREDVKMFIENVENAY